MVLFLGPTSCLPCHLTHPHRSLGSVKARRGDRPLALAPSTHAAITPPVGKLTQNLLSLAPLATSNLTFDRKVVQMKAKRKFTRSRTGCLTCRARRKKCDEMKPVCDSCKRLGLICKSPWSRVDVPPPASQLAGQAHFIHANLSHSHDHTTVARSAGRMMGTIDLKSNVVTNATSIYDINNLSSFPAGPYQQDTLSQNNAYSHVEQSANARSRSSSTWSHPTSQISHPTSFRAGQSSSSGVSTASASSGARTRSNTLIEDDGSSFYSQSTFYSHGSSAYSEKIAELMTIESAGKAKVVEIPEAAAMV